MSMPPEMNEMPLEDFDPERDLAPVADFVDEFLMSAEGAEGEMPVEGGDITAQIQELSEEGDDASNKDIKAANKQLVMDNLEAFIAKLQEMGPPNQWPSDLGPELRRAFQLAWSHLDANEKKAITSGQDAAPADPDAAFDAEKELMLSEA